MGFGKKLIFLITVLLTLLIMLAAQKEQEPDGLLSVDVSYGDRTENIRCWQWDWDEYFLYLPGNVDLRQIQLRFTGGSGWLLDGRPLKDRLYCDQFPLNTPLPLEENGAYAGALTIYQSSEVGAMFVQTGSGTMEHIHARKGNEERAMLRLYTASGEMNHNGVVLAINGRGNSTWNEEKKSYSVELAEEADLLDMGSASKWILLSNVYDGTNLHNKIIYEFARDFGLAYSPECDWVDLYLNGEYAGLYLLCERNEVHPQRVSISQKDSFLVARDAYWRFEAAGKPYITTESGAPLRIYHVGMDTEELVSIWQSAENAILSEEGVDPVTGKAWQEWIDVDSWVRKYLVDEVFANKDGTALSQFYYYDSTVGNGRIFAGPVWDYDLTMGLDRENPQESVQRFFANVPDTYGSAWPDALYRKQDYFNQICLLYEKEFLPLLEEYENNVIPRYARKIAEASRMNASRWGMGESVCDAQPIIDFLKLRTDFLKDVWLNQTEYCFINAVDENYVRQYYAVKPGSTLPACLRFESADANYQYIWYDTHTGAVFPVDVPIWTDADIYVRYEPVVVPEQAAPTEMITQESQPAEEVFIEAAPRERLPVIRLLPSGLFVCMLILITAAGIYQTFTGRKKR